MVVLQKVKQEQAHKKEIADVVWSNPWNLVFTNEFGQHLCHFRVKGQQKTLYPLRIQGFLLASTPTFEPWSETLVPQRFDEVRPFSMLNCNEMIGFRVSVSLSAAASLEFLCLISRFRFNQIRNEIPTAAIGAGICFFRYASTSAFAAFQILYGLLINDRGWVVHIRKDFVFDVILCKAVHRLISPLQHPLLRIFVFCILS